MAVDCALECNAQNIDANLHKSLCLFRNYNFNNNNTNFLTLLT